MPQVGFMITNGGPHPADKWAMTTTGKLMNAIFGQSANASSSARKFENKLIDIFEELHTEAQKSERKHIKVKGKDRLYDRLDPTEYLGDVVEKVVAAAADINEVEIDDQENPGQKKTVSLKDHFQKELVQKTVSQVIGSDVASIMDIERDWHAHRNPNCPHCRAYRKARAEHGGGRAHEHIKSIMEKGAD